MGTEAKVARWGQKLNYTEPMAQNFSTLAFPLGLMKTTLDFFQSEMDGDETLRT